MESSSNLYFVFSVNNSLYAIDALAVNMTFSLPAICNLEDAPSYIAGVINLRGSIIPILDLSLLLGAGTQEKNLSDAILVIQSDKALIGMIVNEVLDVINISSEQIDPPPRLEGKKQRHTSLVLGMARVDEQIISILDHRRLVDQESDLMLDEQLHTDLYKTPDVPSNGDKSVYQKRAAELMRKVEADTDNETLQLAVVLLGQEYFGMDIRYVNEFTKIKNIIPLPNCPQHVLGNMNLRGSILTIIDIRNTLGMYSETFNHSAKIVVSSAGDILVGVAVNEIDDIVQISPTEVVPLPASTHPDVLRYVMGTVHYNQKAMTILNLPEILRNKDLVVNER
ncbi:MAG: chemotaxis protein CheW [Burkholderiales bacterium]|nr:chemotaxis protein CheW [Burkholderiales bacterium]